jgi:hypothetical protein
MTNNDAVCACVSDKNETGLWIVNIPDRQQRVLASNTMSQQKF